MSSTTAESGLSTCLMSLTIGDGMVHVGSVLIAHSLAGMWLSSAVPGSTLQLPAVVLATCLDAYGKELGSFEGWGSGWLAHGVTTDA